MSWFERKKILVTGAGGFVGQNLVKRLSREPCTILRWTQKGPLPFDAARTAEILDVKGAYQDKRLWEEYLGGVDIVYHLAAQTSVEAAHRNPKFDFDSNVLPMLNLLEICRDKGYEPFIVFAGTVTQCGVPKHIPVDENARDNPQTIYDSHKLLAEQYLKQYAAEAAARGVSLRLANVYGPGPLPGNQDRGILNQMILRALAGQPLFVYAPIQNCLRDFVYIEDVVEAFLLAAENGAGLNGKHFVIGFGCGTSLKTAFQEVADSVSQRTARTVGLQSIMPITKLQPIDFRDFVAFSRAFMREASWRPKVSLKEGIQKTLEALIQKVEISLG